MLQLAHPLVRLHRSDRVRRPLREDAVVISSGEAVPPTPSSMPPRRPPSSTRHRESSVPSRLCACPRRATRCPNARDPAAPICPPSDAACAAHASTPRAMSHGATPQPVGWSLSHATRPHRAHVANVLSRFPRARDHGTAPGSFGGRAPRAPAWYRPTPRLPQRGSPLAGCLLYGPAGMCAGHAWRAPRSSARRAPSPALHAGRLSSGAPPPGCAACPCAVVSRWRTAPKALPQRHPVPPGRDGVVRCALRPA